MSAKDLDIDPVIGLEKIRREYLDELSKTAFYGSGGRPGFVDLLDVIEISERRRGARLSNLNAVLDARVRQPRRVEHDHRFGDRATDHPPAAA